MSKYYYTYIATNKNNTVLYTGVTNNLERRLFEHKNKLIKGFTSKYNVCKIIWYNVFDSAYEAIFAEKRIKGGLEQKRLILLSASIPCFKI